jgi:hypothetical protein
LSFINSGPARSLKLWSKTVEPSDFFSLFLSAQKRGRFDHVLLENELGAARSL